MLPIKMINMVNIIRLLFLFSAIIFGNNLTKTFGHPREKMVPKISDHAIRIATKPISSVNKKLGCKIATLI